MNEEELREIVSRSIAQIPKPYGPSGLDAAALAVAIAQVNDLQDTDLIEQLLKDEAPQHGLTLVGFHPGSRRSTET